MRVLLDTNILIPLEDTGKVLDDKLAEIKRFCGQLHHELFFHPLQTEDINNDRDEQRRSIVLSRMNQYSTIQNPPQLSKEERIMIGWRESNSNDRTDNALLYAIRQHACNILVTEDNNIHTKARDVGIDDRVLYMDQFREFLRGQMPEEYISPPDVTNEYLYNLRLESEFFNSLRNDYSGFDKWFIKSRLSGRMAWCIPKEFNTKELGAICIYKDEEDPLIADDTPPLNGKTLKLCTFKIDSAMSGKKLGERLLYIMFNYCVEHKIKYVYIHIWKEKYPFLVSLCEDFGFENVGIYEKRDSVFLKKMQPEHNDTCTAAEYAKKYYPLYKSDSTVKKYIIPIRPEYHEMLFYDISNEAQGLFPSMVKRSSANTIRKAYICHAKTRKIKPGDIVLFYRSKDRKSIECIGVVEEAFPSNSYQEIMAKISKRTVYNKQEVINMARKEVLVIMCRLMKYIYPPITLDELQEYGIKGPFQSIRQLDNDVFNSLLSRLQ